ncbi:hypothetical protein [Methanolobus bombayensis]|uniref:hypothetical protein n=1 Tax=Methanolobus bombayensis TaxID=38023 RepID=UPI001AEA616B|nr:hypothetical protein [Methanolobus bombayensis]MBP1908313.1 hypothetical protein [Methanolobus bombayensis]
MAKSVFEGEWLFTSPSNSSIIKRGDVLGWQKIANDFSDMLAPDLNNGTHDARWISILSWCLVVSNTIPLRQDFDRSELYKWLKPLEVFWIKATLEKIASDNKYGNYSDYQLPGRRKIKEWSGKYNDLKELLDDLDNFRYSGIYGTYRTILKNVPGFTEDCDGWTPDIVATDLANQYNIPYQKNISARGNPQPNAYWLGKTSIENSDEKSLWDLIRSQRISRLPTSKKSVSNLTKKEEQILISALFSKDGNGKRRRIVANAIEKSNAQSYADLCNDVSKKLQDIPDAYLLCPFSRLSDSAIDLLNNIWNCIKDKPRVTLSEVHITGDCRQQLKNSVDLWIEAKNDSLANNFRIIDQFVSMISDIDNMKDADLVRCIVNYHSENCRGRKWMQINNEYVEPLLFSNTTEASYYRFRLWQLSRLALQCGFIHNIPGILSQESFYMEDYDE